MAMQWRNQEAEGKQRAFTVQPASFNSKSSDYAPFYLDEKVVFSS